MSTSDLRRVSVDPGRLAGWLNRFAERHGALRWSAEPGGARIEAADGARALLRLPGPPASTAVPLSTAELVAAAEAFCDFGLVLVRRGGYSIGAVRGARLIGSRCGTRYVQGRTKAGGWSQQRYARRRANQAGTVVTAAAQAVRDVLGGQDQVACALACGGDRPMVRAVLEQSSVAGAADRVLPDWLDVHEPRRAVLEASVATARAVRIELNALA